MKIKLKGSRTVYETNGSQWKWKRFINTSNDRHVYVGFDDGKQHVQILVERQTKTGKWVNVQKFGLSIEAMSGVIATVLNEVDGKDIQKHLTKLDFN